MFCCNKLPEFFKDEQEPRKIWSVPDTRKLLLIGLADKGFGRDQLLEMQKIIDAEKSDIYDVLAYVAYPQARRSCILPQTDTRNLPQAGYRRISHFATAKVFRPFRYNLRCPVRDTKAMDGLLAENFIAVSAAGRVAETAQLLDRKTQAGPVYKSLDAQDIEVRCHGSAVVILGTATVDSHLSRWLTIQASTDSVRVYVIGICLAGSGQDQLQRLRLG